jgi:HAMP domain-containing protein
MRFATRVFLALIGAAIVTHGILFALIYRSARESLFREMRVQVANIAATGALTIDAESHEKIRGPEDVGTPEYQKLVRQARAVRDANRRTDIQVKFVYTARPNPAHPSGYEFVIDAEESAEEHSAPGEPFPDLPEPLVLELPRADENFSTDQWGVWLSASAPIRDAAGEAVAVFGVDVAADHVRSTLAALWWRAAGSLAISFAAAGVLAWLIFRWIRRPIIEIERAVERVGRGDYPIETLLAQSQDFGSVARALNLAARTLRERQTLKENLARIVGDRVAGQFAPRDSTSGDAATGAAPAVPVALIFAGFRDASDHLAREAPGESSHLIEELCAAVIEGIVEFGGEVVSFHHEGLLAVFDQSDTNQGAGTSAAVRAMRAAFKVRRQTEKLFWRWMAEGKLSDRPWLGVSVDVPDDSTAAGASVTGRITTIDGLTRELSVGVLASPEIAKAVAGEIELWPATGGPTEGRLAVFSA